MAIHSFNKEGYPRWYLGDKKIDIGMPHNIRLYLCYIYNSRIKFILKSKTIISTIDYNNYLFENLP